LVACFLPFMSARSVGHATAINAEAIVAQTVVPKKEKKLENAGEERKNEITIVSPKVTAICSGAS